MADEAVGKLGAKMYVNISYPLVFRYSKKSR
jgi:hypothetical protein